MRTLFPLLALCILLSCGSGSPQVSHSASTHPLDHTTLSRKIALMIRSQFTVPPSGEISLGPRTASSIPGYDKLRVTIALPGTSKDFEFLISKDNKTLARLDKFNLDANPALAIDITGRPLRGNPSAPITVVNFDDLECPVCAYLHKQLFPAAFDRYGNDVRFIYKDNPLVDVHPWALHAAVDAACLASESAAAYWQYVDYVHSHVDQVSGKTHDLQRSFAVLDQIAGEKSRIPGVDTTQVQSCLKKQDQTPVRQSMKEAARLGLTFTPALFVNGEEVRGYTSTDDLWHVIDRALRDRGIQPPKQ